MEKKVKSNAQELHNTIQPILDYFAEGNKIIKYPTKESPNITLVLGNTGAGKSTIVQYIAGNNSNLISVPVGIDAPLTGEYIIKDTNKRIGELQIQSHTKIPELTFDSETNTSLYDCPGFEDNRNATYDITGTYFINRIIEKAKGIKFVFVVNYQSVKPNIERSDFMKLAKHATDMIKDINKFNDSICLVATKVDVGRSDIDIFNTIGAYLKMVKGKLRNTTVVENQNKIKNIEIPEHQTNMIIKFIDVLLTREGGNFTKLGFIRQPTEPGPFSEIPEMQKHKESLLKLLHLNTKFTVYDSTDFNYTISADSRNYVGKLSHEIYEQMSQAVNVIIKLIQQYYDTLILETENRIQSFTMNGVTVNTNLLDATAFPENPNKGIKNIEKIVNDIDTSTNATQLFKKDENIASFNVFVKSDTFFNHITTISNLGSLYEFLQPFHNTTLPLKKWGISFNDTATRLNSTECLQKIIVNLTFIKIGSCNPTSSSSYFIDKLKCLEYLENLDNTRNQSFECTARLDYVIKYLKESKNWYDFLLQLYDRLSEYEIQKDVQTYNNIDKNTIQEYKDKPVRSTSLKKFLDKCCQQLSFHQYKTIENIVLDTFKLNALEDVLDLTIRNVIETNEPCNLKLVINGQFVKMSDIIEKKCSAPIQYLEIFALNTVFIDTTLNKTGETLQLSIIAPKWEVAKGKQKIILDGKPGEAQEKAKNGAFGGIKGDDGKPGKPGGSAGNFIGFGETCINCENLIISVNGGDGGPGQEGGDGGIGKSNNEIPIIHTELGHIRYIVKNPFPQFVKDGFEIREGMTQCAFGQKQYKAIFNPDNCTQNFDIFKFGGNGGNGGNGGSGGMGGLPGQVTISFINKANFSISNMQGEKGSDGFGGSGGMPSKSNVLLTTRITNIQIDKSTSNETITCLCPTKDQLIIWENSNFTALWSKLSTNLNVFIKEVENTSENSTYLAKHGANGITGANAIRVKKLESIPLTNPSYTVNTYNNYLRKHFINHIRESDLKNFLSQIKHNEVMNKFYDALGFIHELYTLEDLFYQLHKKLSFLPFYKSLLEKIDEYVRKSSLQMSEADKKVFSYLYTATLSRICTENRGDGDFIIDLTHYLEITLNNHIKNWKNFELTEQINKYKNIYQKKLQEKINEANMFVETDIQKEMVEIIGQTDNQIKLFIHEINTQQNTTYKESEQFQETCQKLEEQLRYKFILGYIQAASKFLSVAGQAVGTFIPGASAVVETVGSVIGGGSKATQAGLVTGSPSIPEKPAELPKAVNTYTVNQMAAYYSAKQQFLKLHLNATKQELDKLLKENSTDISIKQLQSKIVSFQKNIEQSEGNISSINPAQKIDLENELQKYETNVRSTTAWKEFMLLRMAIKAGDLGIDQEIQADQTKIIQTYEILTQVDEKIYKLKQHEDSIYQILIPACESIQQTILSYNNQTLTGNKSLSALDVSEWKIQSIIKDLQLEVQTMTQGFAMEENMRRCVEKLEYGMITMVQVYDRIQQYGEHKQFADYNNNTNSKNIQTINVNNTELSNAINKFNLIIQFNVVLKEYDKILDAFLQFKFPYAASYLDEYYELTAYFRKFNTTSDLVDQAANKLTDIKIKLDKNQAPMDSQAEHRILNVLFDKEPGSRESFFTWRHDADRETISKLLQGQNVTIEANITKAALKMNAIKFTEIRIRFKLLNDQIQSEFDEQLENFSVKMIHPGTSFYRCGQKIYILTHQTLTITHRMNKSKEGKYTEKNDVYENIQRNFPVLSPYTYWNIELFQRNANHSNFAAFKKYLNQTIDLHLVGSGEFITRDNDVEVCDNVEKYYTLHKVIPELDYTSTTNKQKYHRKRRSISNIENQRNVSKPYEEFNAKSSATMITSPINYAIKWLKGSLQYLKFFDKSSLNDTFTPNNTSFNFNASLLLTDVVVRHFTKMKPYNANEKPIDLLELKAWVLDIVTEFESLLNQISTVNNIDLQFDPIYLMGKLETEIIHHNFMGIGKVLYQSIILNNGDLVSSGLDEITFSTQIQTDITIMLNNQKGGLLTPSTNY